MEGGGFKSRLDLLSAALSGMGDFKGHCLPAAALGICTLFLSCKLSLSFPLNQSVSVPSISSMSHLSSVVGCIVTFCLIFFFISEIFVLLFLEFSLCSKIVYSSIMCYVTCYNYHTVRPSSCLLFSVFILFFSFLSAFKGQFRPTCR